MKTESTVAGLAALSICESLLVALTDQKVINLEEAASVLEDAAAAHRNAAADAKNPQAHDDVADLIDTIIKGRNSVRHF